MRTAIEAAGKGLVSGEEPEEHASGAKQAAEKGMVSDDIPQEHPSAAKADVDSMPLTARLKSCPFKAASFSAACKAHLHFRPFAARLKLCPVTKH